MLLGYNSNGLVHHGLHAGLQMLHGLGYRSVALTLDHCCLNPFGRHLDEEIAATRELLRACDMRSVVETGARFLLDPLRSHQPTLLADDPTDRAQRADFIRRAVDIAAALGSDCVTVWSGRPPSGIDRATAMDRLAEGLGAALDYAAGQSMPLAFEPEPDMLIDTMESYRQLHERLAHPLLRLTLDIGHLHCVGDVPLEAHIRAWGPYLANVHIEDMVAGVHDHLMFGAGEIDFPPVIAALSEVGYQGGVHVELSRHSHEAPDAARQSRDFLAPLLEQFAERP
jgi:sugar phosphate isomerase/epimerase